MAASMCRRLTLLPRRISLFSPHNFVQFAKCEYSTVEPATEELVEVPQAKYPPIIPPFHGKTKESEEYRTQVAIDDLNAKPTAKDMIYELSKQQKWHYIINPTCFHNSFLNLYKHCMKTVMVDSLPEQLEELAKTEEVDEVATRLKPHVIDCILQEHLYTYRHRGDLVKRDYHVGKQTMENVMRVMLTGLSADMPHLRDGETDEDVNVKAFWKRDTTRFQFTGTQLFAIRSKDPLPEFISRDSELSVGEVPSWPYAPENVSVFKRHINPDCFPGYKVGNPYNFGHTQVYVPSFDRLRCKKQNLLEEVLMGCGLSASFGWLHSLAMYNMFNPYKDLTQPMTCQTIVTNGSKFSFFCYQLNTLGLSERSQDNPLRNVCWHTEDLSLYGDIKDGKVRDFNNEILKMMVAFLMNRTVSL
ncbi:large ribosomal subunit protein mL65-like [Asterias amurensis]|uniref:large ribosomal subunit protein mL65-like n=1 Tax=Asterias amurensis TaxID=7602 RepID=UPI003AB57CD6